MKSELEQDEDDTGTLRFKYKCCVLSFLDPFILGKRGLGLIRQLLKFEPVSISISARKSVDALLKCQGETTSDLQRNLADELFWDYCSDFQKKLSLVYFVTIR